VEEVVAMLCDLVVYRIRKPIFTPNRGLAVFATCLDVSADMDDVPDLIDVDLIRDCHNRLSPGVADPPS
jgi:hypothetical protein